jgi:tetratricopeptide (TPR) repeat protein
MRACTAARLLRLISLLLVVALPAPAHAGEREALYEEAVQAFGAGDYPRAAALFAEAQAAGVDDAALYYNLGVTYYRLGRLEAARQAFLKAAADPAAAALATYNLGLIALRRDDAAAARRHFEQAHRLATTPELRQLSLRALDRLPPERLSGLFWASLGYDDNVGLQGQRSGADERAAGFAEVFGHADVLVQGAEVSGLYLFANTLLRRLSAAERFNLSSLSAGGALRRPLGNVQLFANQVWIGDAAFTRSVGLEAELQRPLAGAHRLEAGYGVHHVEGADAALSFLDGWEHALTVRLLGGNAGLHRWSAAYSAQYSDRRGLWNGGDFFSFSPRRHELAWRSELRWRRDYLAELDLAYRYSLYAEPEQRQGQTLERREEHQYRAQLGLFKALMPDWRLGVVVRYVHNEANFGTFTYDRFTATLTSEHQF